MRAWPFVFLGLSIALVVTTGAPLGEENIKPTKITPQPLADDVPCHEIGCRAGKRSNEDPSLMKRLRLAQANTDPQNDPACIA